jgi:hypothetical protein
MNLTDAQIWVAVNALRVAAARYAEDATAMRAQGSEQYNSVARQFDKQEKEARELADHMEEQS